MGCRRRARTRRVQAVAGRIRQPNCDRSMRPFPVHPAYRAILPVLWVLGTFGDHAASRNLRSSRSRLALPYIWRLIVFSRLICPSTWPLLQASVTAARTAS